MYLVWCSRAITRAPGCCSGPTICSLPWVERRISKLTGVQHRVFEGCLNTKREEKVQRLETTYLHASRRTLFLTLEDVPNTDRLKAGFFILDWDGWGPAWLLSISGDQSWGSDAVFDVGTSTEKRINNNKWDEKCRLYYHEQEKNSEWTK